MFVSECHKLSPAELSHFDPRDKVFGIQLLLGLSKIASVAFAASLAFSPTVSAKSGAKNGIANVFPFEFVFCYFELCTTCIYVNTRKGRRCMPSTCGQGRRVYFCSVVGSFGQSGSHSVAGLLKPSEISPQNQRLPQRGFHNAAKQRMTTPSERGHTLRFLIITAFPTLLQYVGDTARCQVTAPTVRISTSFFSYSNPTTPSIEQAFGTEKQV